MLKDSHKQGAVGQRILFLGCSLALAAIITIVNQSQISKEITERRRHQYAPVTMRIDMGGGVLGPESCGFK